MANIAIKPAYRVKSWGDKIEPGEGFHITYSDWFQQKKAFFRASAKDEWSMVDAEEVVYSEDDARDRLCRERKAQLDYYRKQVNEYQQKLDKLMPKK